MYGIENSVSEDIADVALRITGSALSSLAERDSRADGGIRNLVCTARGVSIKRQLQGISMQLTIPAQSYIGIVLSIFTSSDGLPFYRIAMPHPDPDLAIILFEARDDRDVIAVWNAWSRYFALPKLMERHAGVLECETVRVGATIMGSRPLWRRRGSALSKRKPKLLIRRRNAHVVLKKNAHWDYPLTAQEV